MMLRRGEVIRDRHPGLVMCNKVHSLALGAVKWDGGSPDQTTTANVLNAFRLI